MRAAEGPGKGRMLPHFGLGLSLLLHAVVVLWLVTHVASKGLRQPQPRHVVVISLDTLRETGKPSAQAVAPAPPVKEPPKLQPVPMRPAPTAPPKKAALPKRMPEHTTATSTPRPPQASAAAPQTSANTPVQKHGDEGESFGVTLLGRVRENWLRPASSALSFHCRLRIDYLAGGTISNVVVLDGCGNNPLDDSVERAVWKTQPLPLGPTQGGPGSVILDFTP
jgi:TonB family protein